MYQMKFKNIDIEMVKHTLEGKYDLSKSSRKTKRL